MNKFSSSYYENILNEYTELNKEYKLNLKEQKVLRNIISSVKEQMEKLCDINVKDNMSAEQQHVQYSIYKYISKMDYLSNRTDETLKRCKEIEEKIFIVKKKIETMGLLNSSIWTERQIDYELDIEVSDLDLKEIFYIYMKLPQEKQDKLLLKLEPKRRKVVAEIIINNCINIAWNQIAISFYKQHITKELDISSSGLVSNINRCSSIITPCPIYKR